MARISKVTKNKNLTGREIGRMLTRSLIAHVRQLAPPMKQREFEEMLATIRTQKDYLEYRGYASMCEAVREMRNKAEALFQQVFHGYYNYLQILTLCERTTAEQAQADFSPILMTPEQYERARQKAQAIKDKEMIPLNRVFFRLLSSYLAHIEAEPEEGVFSWYAPIEPPPAVVEAIERTKQEAFTHKRLLLLYKKVVNAGAYRLPDGRMSDSMSREEWQAALNECQPPKTPEEEEAIALERAHALRGGYEEIYNYIFKDIVFTAEEEKLEKKLEGVPRDTLIAAFSLLVDDSRIVDVDEESEAYELYEFLREFLDKDIVQWVQYAAPADYSKYDALVDYMPYYEGRTKHASPLSGLKAFKRDFPQVYDSVMRIVGRALRCENWKEEALCKSISTIEELRRSGLFEADKQLFALTDSDIAAADGARVWSGTQIAIIQNAASFELDEEGRYMPRRHARPCVAYTLESINKSTIKKEVYLAIASLIRPAYKYIFAYNTMLQLIEEEYETPGLATLAIDTSVIDKKLASLEVAKTMLMYHCYMYPDSDKKLALLQEVFPAIDTSLYRTKEENIEKMRARMAASKYTPRALEFFGLDCFNRLILDLAGLDKFLPAWDKMMENIMTGRPTDEDDWKPEEGWDNEK